jgi:hypothetical protein
VGGVVDAPEGLGLKTPTATLRATAMRHKNCDCNNSEVLNQCGDSNVAAAAAYALYAHTIKFNHNERTQKQRTKAQENARKTRNVTVA